MTNETSPCLSMKDFRRHGGHIVPVGGKSQIIKPLAMAKLLNIPVYVVCDADTDKEDIKDEERRESQISKHKKDNKSILLLLGYDSTNEWPDKTIYKTNLTMWDTNLSKIVGEEFNSKWDEFKTKACLYYGNPGGLKKNPLAIARALKIAWDEGYRSKEINKLIKSIVNFVKNEN